MSMSLPSSHQCRRPWAGTAYFDVVNRLRFGPFLIFLLLAPLTLFGAGAEKLRIITMGDSITRGVRPDVEPQQTFAALLQKGLAEHGIDCEVSNAGIGGDTADALKRLQAGVIAKKPHLVTIMYGTNDSYVVQGKTQGRNSLASYEASLRQMIRELKKAGIAPVLMTSPPWAEGAHLDGLGQNPTGQLSLYVDVCRAVAKDMDVPLVDHFAHWTKAAQEGADLRKWTSDFCHPNPKGHQEMAALMLRTILPLAQAMAGSKSS